MQGRNRVSAKDGSRPRDPENNNQTSPARITHNVVPFNIGVAFFCRLLRGTVFPKSVGMCKSISTSMICKEHPEVKQELWGGEFWEDGYFVRTVGDRVTADVISNYTKYHREQ